MLFVAGTLCRDELYDWAIADVMQIREKCVASGPAVVEVLNKGGAGPFVLVCDHASNQIPAEFGNLGLDAALLQSHIAWDPGAREVAQELARQLDAPLIASRVSRLVHDCNRPAGSADAVPVKSDILEIPGNRNLTSGQRRDRARRFYEPFHDTVRATILDRVNAGHAPILVTIHSFTPVYQGQVRAVDLGIVHDEDARFADAILAIAGNNGELVIGRNDPYGPEDGVTHTLRVHALPLGLLNVMIEIKDDLIGDAPARTRMAQRLAGYLNDALARMDPQEKAASHA